MNLPWWFPLPDAFVEKAAKLMTGKVAPGPQPRPESETGRRAEL